MVLSHDAMNQMVERTTSERRTSSPIGIPNAKLATLERTHQNITEGNESQENSPLSPPTPHMPTMSTSLPAMPHIIHASRFLNADGHLHSLPQKTDSIESIGEILDRLPEGSPAFATVFSEIVKLTEDEEMKNKSVENTNSSIKEPDNKQQDETPNQIQLNSSPRRVRKEIKNLTFDLENLQTKGYRRRAVSASSSRKSKKEPSSTHSTPALARRSKVNNQPKVVHLIPKYKFLTETVTVSHEDIVLEQEREERLRNGFSSPKSIFGAVGEASSPTY